MKVFLVIFAILALGLMNMPSVDFVSAMHAGSSMEHEHGCEGTGCDSAPADSACLMHCWAVAVGEHNVPAVASTMTFLVAIVAAFAFAHAERSRFARVAVFPYQQTRRHLTTQKRE